jgi:hypothetical protein
VKVRRPELVLAGAVLLCLPMVPGVLNGAVGVTTALVRFLIALLACWAGGAVLTTLLDRYSEQSRRDQIMRAIDSAHQRTQPDAAGHAAVPPDIIGPAS